MKIVHVITGLGIGGAENVLCRFVESTTKTSVRNIVVSLSSDLRLGERVRNSGAKLYSVDMKNPAAFPFRIAELTKIIAAEDPHIVQGWMYHGNLAAALATRSTNLALLWSVRQCLYELSDEKMLTRQVIRLNAMLSARPENIIYNSVLAAEHHEKIGFRSEGREIIPNGFDIDLLAPDERARTAERSSLGLSDHEFVVGMIGRYHPVKDHRSFIAGAAKFLGRYDDVKIVLIGSGTSPDNLELGDELRTAGIAERVILYGERQDVPSLLNALDVVVSTSRAEAFPNVIGEAMANGCVCIATDVGEVPRLMRGTGFVIPVGGVDELAAALHETLSMGTDGRRRAGANARREIMENYSLSTMVERMIQCYQATAKEVAKCVA